MRGCTSPELLFSEISPKRWGVLEAMSGAGERQ
jgi:hypothetical protein